MITVDSAGRRHQHLADRVRTTADDLGRLAARTLRGTLPRVRILITDGTDMIRIAKDADTALAGPVRRRIRATDTVVRWCLNRRDLGATVYDRRGALVLINAPRHRSDRELDRTVIHELGHTVQLNAPGARDQYATYLRMQLGVTPRDPRAVDAYHRAMDIREQQAANLEALVK